MTVKTMSLQKQLFAAIASLIVGSVFVFGMRYWNAQVERDDCEVVTTQLESIEKVRGSHYSHIRYVKIKCTNGSSYNIEDSCMSSSLLSALESLPEGTQLTLTLHPNSEGKVLELSADGILLLDFDTAVSKLGKNATAFSYIGLFMYLCSAVLLVDIVQRKRKQREED